MPHPRCAMRTAQRAVQRCSPAMLAPPQYTEYMSASCTGHALQSPATRHPIMQQMHNYEQSHRATPRPNGIWLIWLCKLAAERPAAQAPVLKQPPVSTLVNSKPLCRP